MVHGDCIHLVGDGMADGQLQAFVNLHQQSLGRLLVLQDAGDGMEAIADSPGGEHLSPIMVVCSKLSDSQLGAYSKCGFHGLCEWGDLDEDAAHYLADVLRGGGAAFSLSTKSAFGNGVAEYFCHWIGNHVALSQDLRSRLEMSVQEAIANAVLHGNLEIGPGLRGSLEALEQFSRILDERLNEPVFADRRVTLAAQWNRRELRVSVRDQGQGYDTQIAQQLSDNRPIDVIHEPVGRGLHIIKQCTSSVAIGAGGRDIEMVFAV